MMSSCWLLAAIFLACTTASIHPRKGWSFFMREMEKPSFKPIGSANILEDLGVTLEWSSCPEIEVALFIDGNAYVKCKTARPISVYSTIVSAEKGEKSFELLGRALCTQLMRNAWPDLIGVSVIKGSESSKQLQLNIYSLTSSLARNNQAQYPQFSCCIFRLS